MYRRLFLGIFTLIVMLLPSHIINAQTAEEKVGAMIDYPYYKKTERWVFTCREGTTCNKLKSKWTEEKTGEATKGNFRHNIQKRGANFHKISLSFSSVGAIVEARKIEFKTFSKCDLVSPRWTPAISLI